MRTSVAILVGSILGASILRRNPVLEETLRELIMNNAVWVVAGLVLFFSWCAYLLWRHRQRG